MMNVIALGLVLSSLVTSGIWSPNKVDVQRNKISTTGGEDIIVKEGHRVVVVEYDLYTDGNTKVLISPHDTHVSHKAKEKLSSFSDDAKGKTEESLEDAHGKMKEKIDHAKEKTKVSVGRQRELLCDTVGRGKQKIAGVMGKAKDMGLDAAHDITEEAHNVEEHGKDKASVATAKTKDASSNIFDKVSSKSHEVKETVYDKAQQVAGGVKEAVDTGKTIGNDVAKNYTSKMEDARQKTERVKEEGDQELEEIFRLGRELVKDMWSYIVSPRSISSTMGIVHLLGFATAYGMCVWVTFVSSNVLAGALPMQQFGMVQSKVYPVYFRVLAYTVMVTLTGHLYGERKRLSSNTVRMAQVYSLLGSFTMVLFNLLYLEPRATKVMFRRMKLEKEEGRGLGGEIFVTEPTKKLADHYVSATPTAPVTAAGTIQSLCDSQKDSGDMTVSQINKLSERLKKLNAYSSFLNILTVVALTSHLAYLGQRLHVTC